MNYLIRIRQIHPLPSDVEAGRRRWLYRQHPREREATAGRYYWREKQHPKAWRLKTVPLMLLWKARITDAEHHQRRLLRGIVEASNA